METPATREQAYNSLIAQANERIRRIKSLPYYRVFSRRDEQRQDIRKKLELIVWLTNRKLNGSITNQ